MLPAAITALPIHAVLPALAAALADRRAAVLEAPPGAGKSTGVPLALLDEPWLEGRILMLEPRRLAARAVAGRMAALRGEAVGETVGYRLRLERRVGPRTRLEVVTEGILTRQLQRDPALEGVGLLIFDEFHERNLQADLGLALALDVQAHLNPALKILVMSATLEGERVARLLNDAPLLRAEGRSFPVTTRYLERRDRQAVANLAGSELIRTVTGAVRRTLAEETGDVLVFLPGGGEIRRVHSTLANEPAVSDVDVIPLYGDLSRDAQDRALRPAAASRRKVVLATNLAETSLTIEGVRVVIDSGLERRPRFDPVSGMGRLETVRIAAASADQRRGRAGRLGPGVCLRLWTEAVQRTLATHAPPEILVSDLAPLALELAAWGVTDPAALRWLDPPPAGALAQARHLLRALGALDPAGRITPEGRAMAGLGAHPRLAHLLLRAKAAGAAATGCALAALLSERDLLPAGAGGERDVDLRLRLEMVAPEIAARAAPTGDGPEVAARAAPTRAHVGAPPGAIPRGRIAGRYVGAPQGANPGRMMPADRQALERVRRTAALYARQLGVPPGGPVDVAAAGWLLATAWPDRIGRSRAPGTGRYHLSNGRGAAFATPQALAKAEFLVIPALDAGEREARIFLAAPLAAGELAEYLGDVIVTEDRVWWDDGTAAVLARRQQRLGQLVIGDRPLDRPDPAAVTAALLEGIRRLGLTALPWDPALRQWQARVLLLRRLEPDNWPDVSDPALTASLEDWLGPCLTGLSRRDHLARLDLAGALRGLLGYDQQRRLDQLAPTHLTMPSGSRISVDYLDGDTPGLAVRLQEVFGLMATPRLAGGRVPVLMKLLSPARRPVQLTRDLESFWRTGYPEVRRELKGRYPKHYWPEDPLQAEPTRRVRPR